MIAAISKAMFGGTLPWPMILIGIALGIVVIIIDEFLRRGGRFRCPVLAVAVGMYLPMGVSVPILIGGLLSHFASRARGSGGSEGLASRGMLYAAGMIAGESLTGVILAIPIVLTQRADAMALPLAWRLSGENSGLVIGVLLYALLGWLLFKTASKRD